MSSRLTLAWDRCEVCGRHYPTSYCARVKAWLCPHCTSLLGCREGGRRGAAPRRSLKLEPDEDFIESVALKARRRRD